MRRCWAATEAQAYGWGGVRAVSSATGLSPNTIRKGLAELSGREVETEAALGSRMRRVGGGRKRRADTDPDLLERLERLVDPVTRGDPDSPLRWTCKSTTQLSQELRRQGHLASPRTVGRLLHAAGYSLQRPRRALPTRIATLNSSISTPQCGRFSSAVSR